MALAILGVTCLAAVLSHTMLFIRGDWDKHAPVLFHCFITCPIAFISSSLIVGSCGIAVMLIQVWLCYIFSTYLSIIIYRLFLHPLRDFPGRVSARLSTLRWMKTAAVDRKWHLEVQKMHNTYGDFVRINTVTGPREISINNSNAIRDLAKCARGPFYDVNYPHKSLQMTRDRNFHLRRKKIWQKAFSPDAMLAHEGHVRQCCQELMSYLSSRAGQPVEVTELMQRVTFESMGWLVFGKAFNMIQTGLSHPGFTQLRSVKQLGGLLLWAPWTLILLRNLPFLRSKATSWLQWCSQEVVERKQVVENPTMTHDLFSHLLDDESKDTDDLVYDSELAVVAGSDSTASTLTAILFLLATHPDKQATLQREVDDMNTGGLPMPTSTLANMPYLNSCINEALRLYPAVMSGSQRETGPGGVVLDGQFIPEHMLVSMPTYTIHRDKRNFVRPDEFIPERWTSQSHLTLNPDAFIPFSVGVYGCLGKPFAMMEIRMVISSIMSRFNLRLLPERSLEQYPYRGGYKQTLITASPHFPS
ncbi:cytochrome P450 [Hypoxylon sp. FL1857]|nr:cytochrome P450 [Hypoxylon sp. FL1857]